MTISGELKVDGNNCGGLIVEPYTRRKDGNTREVFTSVEASPGTWRKLTFAPLEFTGKSLSALFDVMKADDLSPSEDPDALCQAQNIGMDNNFYAPPDCPLKVQETSKKAGMHRVQSV